MRDVAARAGRGRGDMPTRRRKWTSGYGLKTCRKVVIDGANLCWTFGRRHQQEEAEGSDKARPDMEGLRVALSCPVWRELGVEPVVFLPTSCEGYERWDAYACSLDDQLLFESHKLISVENGTITETRSCGFTSSSGTRSGPEGSPRTHLRHKVQRAQAAGAGRGRRPKRRDSGLRSRDDILLLRYAQKNNAWVLSNDRFRDHSVVQRRGWRGWLTERRIGYEFAKEATGFELEVLPGASQWEVFCAHRRLVRGEGGTSGATDDPAVLAPLATE